MKPVKRSKSTPQFTNFKDFCLKIALEEILTQPSENPLVQTFKDSHSQVSRGRNSTLRKHLEMLINHLASATAEKTLNGRYVPNAERLLAFDLANFSLEKDVVPEAADLTPYQQLKTYMPFVCAAAKGEGNFIRSFAWTQNLEISEENLPTYEVYFRESTAQLIGKAASYAMQCSDIRDASYHNYFREIDLLKESGVESSIIDSAKSHSLLHNIRALNLTGHVISPPLAQASSKEGSSDTDSETNVLPTPPIKQIIGRKREAGDSDTEKSELDSRDAKRSNTSSSRAETPTGELDSLMSKLSPSKITTPQNAAEFSPPKSMPSLANEILEREKMPSPPPQPSTTTQIREDTASAETKKVSFGASK